VLFEELDTDSSGDLSWEEISDGMLAFWQNIKLEERKSLTNRNVSKDVQQIQGWQQQAGDTSPRSEFNARMRSPRGLAGFGDL
jgi:hypothetical protein